MCVKMLFQVVLQVAVTMATVSMALLNFSFSGESPPSKVYAVHPILRDSGTFIFMYCIVGTMFHTRAFCSFVVEIVFVTATVYAIV